MRETKLTGKICKELREKHDCFVYNISDKYTAGIPDTMILPPGHREIWVEFKDKDEVPRPIQGKTIKDMRQRGANVFVVEFYGKDRWIIYARNHFEQLIFHDFKSAVTLLFFTLKELCRGEDAIFQNTS